MTFSGVLMSLWGLSSVIATVISLHMMRDNNGGSLNRELFADRENAFLLAIAISLPAILFFGIFCVITYNNLRNKQRTKARDIMRSWENLVPDYDGVKVRTDVKTYNEALQFMRDNARKLSDENLEFLSGLDPEALKIEKVIMDAIVDELLERKICNG